MKHELIFLCLIIPGPEHLRPKFNVMLKALIKVMKNYGKKLKLMIGSKAEIHPSVTYLWPVYDFLA